MATSKFDPLITAIEVVQEFNGNLNGKLILITGGTSGIGIETVRALALTNAHILITSRDQTKSLEVIEDIKKTTSNNNIEIMEMDLKSLQSITNFVNQFRKRQLPIHILICNEEISVGPYSKTIDGFESHFGVNHLAHFYLTTSLLPELQLGHPSRVIVLSSIANKRSNIHWNDVNWENNYDKWLAYGQSKTANILFAKQLNKLYQNQGIQAFSLQPAGILTNLKQNIPEEQQRAMGWYHDDGTLIQIMKNFKQGAATIVYAALAPELVNFGGEYLEDCAISKGVNTKNTAWGIAPYANDMEAAQRLWNLSEQLISNKINN